VFSECFFPEVGISSNVVVGQMRYLDERKAPWIWLQGSMNAEFRREDSDRLQS
jgi:hypothetical protein